MKFLAEERGSAMVELALFVSILIVVLVGMVDYSLVIHEAMLVQQAASVGAAFGAIPGNESNLSGIQAEAASAATAVPGFTATVTNLWTCSAGGASVASSATCSGGVTPYKYVVVKTSGTISPPLTFPGIAPNHTVYGAAIFQVPWSQ